MSDTVVVSQLGARMHYAVPRILHKAYRLERLNTDICAGKGWSRALTSVPQAMLPPSLRRLRGRIPHGIPPAKIRSFEAIGLTAVMRRTLRPSRAEDTRAALLAGRRFSEAVIRTGFGDARAFYGISGECLEQLHAARGAGLTTYVEQIIAPRQIVDNLVEQEAERYPEWEAAIGADPFSDAFAAREKAEWASADVIICPSEFVRTGVEAVGGPAERCVLVPYGVDATFQIAPFPRRRRESGPLRVLTVGTVGLRKGSPYVLQAARMLQRLAEFRLVGPVALPKAVQEQMREYVDLAGPTPRAEIGRHYAWADVFLLPSICEGSATVVYEALAAGLPVITTPNAGSVVRHGVDGFICQPGDVETICEKLAHLAHDRDMLERMVQEARRTARAHDLDGYGRRLLAALELDPHRNAPLPMQASL